MVSGKIFVPSGNNWYGFFLSFFLLTYSVCLKLNLLPDNTVSAEYRFSEEGDWHDMVRGIGWKQTSELVGDEPR